MNRIYKSIWSEQTGTFVAVAENTKARGKRTAAAEAGGQAVFSALHGMNWTLGAVVLALLGAGLLARPAAAQAVDGWDLSVDGGTAFHVAPGGAFALTSGSNMALTQNNGAVTVALNPNLSVDSVTATGAIKGATGEFTGQLSAGSAAVSGALTADTATVTNQLTAGSVSAGSAAFSGALSANTATVTGAVSSGSVSTGALTATGASSLRAVNVNNNKISGLADATVSAASTEAVSGKVLYNALNSGSGMKYFHANSTKADSTAGGADALAIGPEASAAGEAALAAGLQAQAAGKESLALGARAGAGNTVTNGVAVGSDAGVSSTGAGLVAVGNQAGQQIEGANNVAIGNEAGKATSALVVDNTVAIGNKAMAKADNAIAIGNGADVALLANNAIAMGNGAVITQAGVGGTALGSGAVVSSVAGTAVGTGAAASGNGAAAFGTSAQASGGASLAGGSGARAIGASSVALGSGAVSNTQGGVAIGEGAGSGSNSPVVGNRFGHVAVGGLSGQNVSGGYNVAVGYKAGNSVTGDDTVAIGREAGQSLTGERTISIGYGANFLPGQTGSGGAIVPPVTAEHAVAIGERSRSGANSSVALGSKATVADFDIGGIAIGNQALVYAGTATNAAAGGVALGDKARVTHSNSVAIGANSQSAATTGIGYGAPSGAFLPSSSVSFGTVDGERRLSNVAAGRLDTDAVNVSQLKQLHGNLETIIGGGLVFDPATGAMTKASFTLTDTAGVAHSYDSVGAALYAIEVGVAGTINGLNAVTYSNADRTLIDLDSAGGAPVRITNVAAGTAAVDAVNKGQLDSLEASLMDKRMRYVSVNSPNSNPNIDNDGATGSDAVAIGPIARAGGDGSTAIGLNSTAGGLTDANLTTALGANSAAVALGATAVGAGATAESEGAVAMGQSARAADNANFSVAIGRNSEVMGDANDFAHGGVAIGDTARVIRQEGIALGRNAYDEALRGTAIGLGAHVTASGVDSQALGTRATASGSSSTALGVNASVAGSSSLALGAGSITAGNNAVGAGSASTAQGHRSVAVGDKANTGWVEEVDLGNGGKQYVYHGAQAIGVGADADAHEDRALAVGAGAKAMQVDASAFGSNAQALAVAAQAWGKDARASGQNSIAVGNGATTGATAVNGLALGAGSTASAAGAVALGSNSTTAANYTSSVSAYTNITNQEASQGAVSVGNGTQNRRITNLAGGQADTDAVNVAQLKKLDDVLTTRGTNYSGNNFDAGNTATAIHKNLGERVEIRGGATTAGTYSGANVRTQVLNGQLQIQLAETPQFKGADMGGQKITNVAAGTVSSSSTDAVNGSQLYQVENKPVTFQGNTGTTPRKLGETQVIKGSLASTEAANTSNIRTNVNAAGELEILLANNLTADSLTINNNGPVINADGISMRGKKITNLADGTLDSDAVNLGQLKNVEAVANAGWNLGTNGDPATKVIPGGTVDFSNSDSNIVLTQTGTDVDLKLADDLTLNNVTVTGDTTLKNVNVGNGTLVVNDGSLTVKNGTTVNMGGNKITNVAAGTDLTDAVNVSQLTNSETGLTAKGMNFAGQSGTAVHRDLGQTLKVEGSNANITTATEGADTLKIALSENLNLTSITTGDTAMDTSGVKVKGASGQPDVVLGNTGLTVGQVSVTNTGFKAFNVVINDQGINAGAQKITNVAAGTDPTDGVNVSQLTTSETGLTTKGMNFAGQSGTDVHRDLGQTLKVVGSNGNLSTSADGADTLTLALNDDLNLTSVTTGNTSMSNSGVTVKGAAGQPDVIMNSMGFAIGSNIALTNTGLRAGTVIVSSETSDITGLSNLDLTGPDFGTRGRAATEEQLQKVRGETQELADRTVKYDLNGDGTVNKGQVTMEGATSTDGGRTGGTGITNVARGDISSNSTDAVNGSQISDMGDSIAQGMGGGSTFVDGKLVTELNVGGNSYNNVNDALGGLDTKIDNVGQVASAGWNIQTNGDVADKVAPGNTVQFLNGDNIEITRSGMDVKVAMAQDIKVNSVVATSVTTNELKIENGPVINQNGIDMHDKTISNVADGKAPQDAVNVRQLGQATANINNQINHLDRRINKVENRANAGVAAALASAGLPQAYMPGKSMFSMAGGAWNGESGYAMGLSTVSDSGSWVVKGTVAGSSRGDYGGSVGVGFQW